MLQRPIQFSMDTVMVGSQDTDPIALQGRCGSFSSPVATMGSR